MILGFDISDHAIAAAVVSEDATVVAHDRRETKDAAGAADMARLFERHAPSRVAAAVRDPAHVATADLVNTAAGAITAAMIVPTALGHHAAAIGAARAAMRVS